MRIKKDESAYLRDNEIPNLVGVKFSHDKYVEKCISKLAALSVNW